MTPETRHQPRPELENHRDWPNASVETDGPRLMHQCCHTCAVDLSQPSHEQLTDDRVLMDLFDGVHLDHDTSTVVVDDD